MNNFDSKKIPRNFVNLPQDGNTVYMKSHLCPKCNQSYNVFTRNNVFTGKVPLILNCYHTVCEECIIASIANQQVTCMLCSQISPIDCYDKRKLQEKFPVNFYILGFIHYCKPNLKQLSELKLKPAGVKFTERSHLNLSNSSISGSTDLLQPPVQEKCSQEGCRKLANVHCVECDELYCTQCCETLHNSARGLKTHKIASITDYSPQLTAKCTLHKDLFLEVFCNTCNKISCCYCIVQEHKGHDFYKVSDLNLLGDFNLDDLIEKAENKLKQLLLAHKRATEEISHTSEPCQTNNVEVTIGKCFSHVHAKLQLLEKKLQDDIEQFKSQNTKILNSITYDLSLNIRKLNSLINSVKNVNNPNSDIKFDIRAITENLESALSFPSFLIGEPQDANNSIEFNYQDFLNNLDDYFSINFKSNDNEFRLVPENELPSSYNSILYNEATTPDVSANMESISSFSTKSSVVAVVTSNQLSNPSDVRSNAMDVKTKSNQIEGWIRSTQDNLPVIGDRENITVSHIDNPECFYIQFNRLENALQDLSLEIHHYSQMYSLPVKNVELNNVYIVKYDSKWYRGRVIDIKPQPNGNHLYTIFFIDYGNKSVVSSSSILNINSNLLQYNPFAHKCKLFHVFPVSPTWDSKATLHMAKIINESNVVMVIMAQSNGFLEVDLLSVSNVQTTSIRDALIFVGLALPYYDSSTESLKSSKKKSYPKLHARCENFRNGDTLKVIICNVVNPHSLYVQVADFIHHLERLTSSMTNYYNKKNDKERMHGLIRNEHIYVPKMGMVVAAYVESIWSRATVTKVVKGEGTVTIFLEDYGKTVSVDYTKIRKLPERFRNIECQAIHVKLADIMPKSQTWDFKAINYLHQFVHIKKILRLLVVNVGKVPSVALFDWYDNIELCINSALVQEGLAISTGDVSKVVQHVAVDQAPPKKEKTYVFDLMKTIQSTKSHEDDSSESEQENVIRKPVKVLSVKSPDEIFVEIEDPVIQKMQNELHQSLQEYYTKQKYETRSWEINDPCVAYNPANKKFFRGIILEKECDSFKVMLRDVAEEIVIPEHNIFVLQNQFKQFREKAVRCHLANIVPAGDKNKWSGLAVDFLQKVFEKHTKIFMTKNGAIDRNRKSVPVVMWYSEIQHEGPLEPSKTVLYNINKLLVKNGLAFTLKVGSSHASSTPKNQDMNFTVRSTSTDMSGKTENLYTTESPQVSKPSYNIVQNNDSFLCQTSFSVGDSEINSTVNTTDEDLSKKENYETEMIDWLPPVPLKLKHFLAIATFVDYNASIYIHETSKEPVLRTMENEMKNYFANTPPEPMDTVWTLGQLCTVKYFVNDNWYRGKIISIGEDFITVFLIDYGNEEECKHEDLRLKVMYLNLPAFAYKIQLHQVNPKPGSNWLTSDLDELHKKLVENEIHVSVKKTVAHGLPVPAVVKLNNTNINQYMRDYSSNLISTTNQSWADDVYESDDDVIIENEKLEGVVTELEPNDTYIQKSLPESLVGQRIKVTIISIINYNEFILEILIDQDIKKTKSLFETISKEIAEKFEEQPLLNEFKVGKTCIARFSEDRKWYRGEVVDLNNIEAGLAHIWFVDYGNSENVSTEFIRCLHPDWLELPVCQYKTKLEGIMLADPSCLDLVLDCMTDYCNWLRFAEILSVNPLSVKLYDDNNELVYQDLLDQQLLIKTD